jgi:betaine reductase
MSMIKVMHFLNQFFAGLGGEDKADTSVGFCEGPLGPGSRLQEMLGNSTRIVVTAFCGDNYFAKNRDQALEEMLNICKKFEVNIVVAGPAFASGRYGFSCMEVCHFLSQSLGTFCVTGMYIENPGLVSYQQYKDIRVVAFPTSKGVSGMGDALSRIAQCISKIAGGKPVSSASQEGYIPRGLRVIDVFKDTGAKRAVDMLLDKIFGRPFLTEIPVESLEKVPVAPSITSITDCNVALATTCGIILPGNPDGFKSFRNTKWRKYFVKELNSMKDTQWEVLHGGYNNSFMFENPNYGVPLDACRDLEEKHMFSKLYPYFYGTTGVNALISVMEQIGNEMAIDMKAKRINGVLLVSS